MNELLGMWIMNQVLEDSTDVTDAHNPALNRWVEFSEDGTFESGGAPYGIQLRQMVFSMGIFA